MRKDLERNSNMLKKIKNPLVKHEEGHEEGHEENKKTKIPKEQVIKQKEDHKRAMAMGGRELGFLEYVKVNKQTGSSQTKRIIPKINLPEINLPSIKFPKINMPQISLNKGPKPRYFRRKNMMAKNQRKFK